MTTIEALRIVVRFRQTKIIPAGEQLWEALDLVIPERAEALDSIPKEELWATGRHWRPSEDSELLRYFHRKSPVDAVAKNIGRSIGEIYSRLIMLGKLRTDEDPSSARSSRTWKKTNNRRGNSKWRKRK